MISWKQSPNTPNFHLLPQNNETVRNTKKIVNIFNDYVSAIAEKTKEEIIFSNKSFHEFLQYANENSFFLKPISSDEIVHLISSLNDGITFAPNSLPTKIL